MVSYRIKPNLPRLGKRYGKLIPKIRAALANADGIAIATAAAANENYELDIEGQTINFEPEDLLIETQSAEGYACAEDGGFLAALDTTVTPELEREGLAREVVRTIQDARKQAGLDVADRIALRVDGDGLVGEAVHEHRAFIQSETLASTWHDKTFGHTYQVERSMGEFGWTIDLAVDQADS